MFSFLLFSTFTLFFLLIQSYAAPSEGFCQTHNFGGSSSFHYYICCNNCDEVNPVCNRYTYHRASNGTYCGNCGIDSGGGGDILTETFRCGGCAGQQKSNDTCAKKWEISNIPGGCWIFTGCMKHRCKDWYRMSMWKQSDGEGQPLPFMLDDSSFCGDGTCDNDETVEICPMDCCGTVNSRCSMINASANGDCPPACCNLPTCCNHSSKNQIPPFYWIFILLISLIFY